MDMLPAFLMGASGIELILAAVCFTFQLDRGGFFLIVLAGVFIVGAVVR